MTGVDPHKGERLDSWKAISAYLGRDEGTLRRWERTRRFPVRRVPGQRGGSVYAFTGEIDAWLREDTPGTADDPDGGPEVRPPTVIPAPVPRLRWLAAAFAVIAVAVAIGWSWAQPPAHATDLRLEVTDARITASDSTGRRLWAYDLGDEFRHIKSATAEHLRVVGGARPGIYVATEIRYRRTDNAVADGRLAAFDLDGKRRWLFEFDDTVSIGGKPFGPPWGVIGFAVDDSSGARRIAVTAHHYTWGASMVAVLDDAGQRQGTYVNSGWLEDVKWLAPNRLAAAGFRESMNGGLVVLLDPSDLNGQSPETDPAHRCHNCGAATPLQMAVFPRSEVNLITGSRFNRATMEQVGDRLRVRTIETHPTQHAPAEAIYDFTPGLEVVSASFSERYWEVHQELFAAGRLDHDRERCPDRYGPKSIQAWSRAAGWTVQHIR